jgi:protein transport protein SEC13
VNAVSWAPAAHLGSRAAGGGDAAAPLKRIATAGCDNAVRIHVCTRGADGRESWAVEHTLRDAHRDWVRDVAWAPASGTAVNTIASASDDGSVIIWRQAAPGAEWKPEPLPPFAAPVWRVSWSVTGALLAVSCGDNSVTLWKESLAGTWQQISTVPDPTLPSAGQPTTTMGRPGGY